MSPRYDPSEVGPKWALLLGGVTRQGNRRARRLAVEMLQDGLDVVWFDGFEEASRDGERVPLDVGDVDTGLTIIGFRADDERSWAGKLRAGTGMKSNPITRALWQFLLKRIGTALRPRTCWKIAQPVVDELAKNSTPQIVVYCDIYALTSAWYVGRRWRAVPILSGLSER